MERDRCAKGRFNGPQYLEYKFYEQLHFGILELITFHLIALVEWNFLSRDAKLIFEVWQLHSSFEVTEGEAS